MENNNSMHKESINSVARSSLSGKHFIFSGLEAFVDYWPVRNESGYIYATKGLSSYTLSWLSQYFNLTFSPLQVINIPLDTVGNSSGILNFVNRGLCDMAFTVSPTTARTALVDYTQPYLYIPITYLIPRPESSVNFLAVVQPFKNSVWIGILLAVFAVAFFLCLFDWFNPLIKIRIQDILFTTLGKIGNYVFGLLLKQPGYRLTKTMPVLLLAGAWGLAVFLLTNYYTTLLISFVAAPNHHPLIQSIFDLRNRPDLRLVTDKNINIDIIVSTAEAGFYKLLGDKLRAFPDSRCTESRKCVELVKAGKTVYTSGRESYLFKSINEDFKKTGQCNLELGKDNLLEIPMSWAMQKKNPSIPIINIGIMRMRESGLLKHWYKQGLPDVHQCIHHRKQKEIMLDDILSLSLKGLTGAFIVIILGSITAFLVFLGERIVWWFLIRRNKDYIVC